MPATPGTQWGFPTIATLIVIGAVFIVTAIIVSSWQLGLIGAIIAVAGPKFVVIGRHLRDH